MSSVASGHLKNDVVGLSLAFIQLCTHLADQLLYRFT